MSIKMQVILTGKDIIDFCPGKEMSPNITVLLCDTILPIKKYFSISSCLSMSIPQTLF